MEYICHDEGFALSNERIYLSAEDAWFDLFIRTHGPFRLMSTEEMQARGMLYPMPPKPDESETT